MTIEYLQKTLFDLGETVQSRRDRFNATFVLFRQDLRDWCAKNGIHVKTKTEEKKPHD